MKALSFFQTYKKGNGTMPVDPDMGFDVEALKNSVAPDQS
jgi:hypothetical protein